MKTLMNEGRLCGILMLVLCAYGCFRPKYSGDFRIENHSAMNAGVAGADGFGEASPVCGLLPPGSKLGMHFGWIDKFPERTTLRWWDNDAMQEYSQDIDLTNIVHPGVNGTYVFTLSADNKWTVRFDRLEKSR